MSEDIQVLATNVHEDDVIAVIAAGNLGQPGATGAQGPKGDTGAQGPIGPKGDTGAKGDTGTTGAPGPPGMGGATGPAGPQGLQGPKGDPGATGNTGPAGSTGATGAAGPPNVLNVQSVTTVPYPGPAVATITGTSPAQALAFQLPTGPQGLTGPQGSQGIQGVKGDKGDPGDMTKGQADALYETKSTLLQEAAWWVDAGGVTASGTALKDLTGKGRDAVFGAGSAAPTVLPWTGDDYIHFPVAQNNGLSGGAISAAGTASSVEVILDYTYVSSSVYVPQLFQLSTGTDISSRYWIIAQNVGSWQSLRSNGTVDESLALGAISTKRWHRFTYSGLTVNYYDSDDGSTWSLKSTVSHTGARSGFASRNVYSVIGGGSYGFGCAGSLRRFTCTWDGESTSTHVIDPRNVSADYSTTKNTGTAGGNWNINRAATGYKTAVVDRPLLLFGGAQNAVVSNYRPVKGTVIVAIRAHAGATSFYPGIIGTAAAAAANWKGWMLDTYDNGVATRYANFISYPDGTTSQSARSGPDGSWLYGQSVLAATFGQGVSMQMYNNGVAGSVGPVGTAIQPDPAYSLTLGAWGYSNATYQPSNHEMLAAAVWDRVLTDAEIKQATNDLLGIAHVDEVDPHPQYLTQSEGDVLYENRSDTLREALWHVDAKMLTSDSLALKDITGRGRDAVFGAGTAAPIVLPWTGEDYLYFPVEAAGTTNNTFKLTVVPPAGTTFAAQVDFLWSAVPTDAYARVFNNENSLAWYTDLYADGHLIVTIGGVGIALTTAAGVMAVGERATIRVEATATTTRLLKNGVQVASAAFTYAGNAATSAVCQVGYLSRKLFGRVYSARWEIDGVTFAAFDPRNVSADYTTITNSGTGGNSWGITRATSGYKTAVVDRPLLLFGGTGQVATVSSKFADTPDMTLLTVTRQFGTPSTNSMIIDTAQGTGGGNGVGLAQRTTNAWIFRIQAVSGGTVSTGTSTEPDGQGVVALRINRSSLTWKGWYLDGTTYTGSTPSTWKGVHDNPVRFGEIASILPTGVTANFELVAAVLFDRALTDAEIQQVSQELAGVPHEKQTDPHEQYEQKWGTVATWSALPPTGNWPGRKLKVSDGLGLCVAVWNGTAWVVDPVSDTGAFSPPSQVNGWTRLAGAFRRIGSNVFYSSLVEGTSATSDTFINIPMGFRSYTYVWKPVSGYSASPASALVSYDPGVSGAMTITKYVSRASGFYLDINWPTTDAWPTSAPV